MTSILLEDKNIENFQKALSTLQKTAAAIIVFSSAENHFTKAMLDPILQACSVPIIGGIFPAIIYHDTLYKEGSILIGLTQTFSPVIFNNISKERDYDTFVEAKLGAIADDNQSMFTFFDGCAKNIDALIKALFNNYGLTLNYLGGSAGYPDFIQREVLMSNEGLLKDAAIFATTHASSTIGVKHGWQPIDDTLMHITKVDGNIIHEIDYRPAYDVYHEYISKHTTRDFSKEAFFDISINHPLGINRLSGDVIVRVPTHSDLKSITCTGDILENAYVSILQAKDAQLVHAAQEASHLSQDNDYAQSFTLYIGYLARYFICKESYHDELQAIQQEGQTLCGALALGEVANNQDHYLELYNATAVVAQVDDAL